MVSAEPLSVYADNENMEMKSFEQFIFEHYFGYTKINEHVSQEYQVNHPRWLVNKANKYSIQFDFESMYGKNFTFLNNEKPYSVILAVGLAVSVNWKRRKF